MSFNFSQTAGTSGETSIVIAATSTTDIEDRIDNYTIANNSGNSVVMSIMQKAYVPTEKYINLYPSSITWDGSGGTASLQIQSNDNWVITSNSWIELSRFGEADRGLPHNTISGNGNTIIGIRALENTGTTRTGGITGRCISDSAISATTTVVQNTYTEPYIQLSYYSINCDSTGTTSSFTISSNVDWYIVVSERWTSVNTESGSGDASITFTVGENESSFPRSCDITVYARNYDIKVTLVINQDATQLKPYITLSPDSFVVSDKGSTGNTIHVSANCSYDITTETNWITLHSSSGSGDGTVTFDTDPAPLVKFNTGLIEFSNSALSRTVTVERQGEEPYLSASTTSVSVGLDGGAKSVNVYSNVDWVIKVEEVDGKPWINVAPDYGKGNDKVNITINSGSTARAGDILITNTEYGLSWSIKVNQRENNKIFYTTNDGNVTSYNLGGYFGNALITNNVYENGQGVITFDRNVTVIPNDAFKAANYSNKLTTIELPSTIQTIESATTGNGSFNGQNLLVMDVSDLITGSLATIGDRSFIGCSKLYGDLYIPSGVSIGAFTFSGCTGITSVVLPDSLTIVPQGAFRCNTSLESVDFGKNTVGIRSGSFSGCTALKEVELPNSVTGVSTYAFIDCSSITKVTLSSGLTMIDTGAFDNCSGITEFIFPASFPSNGNVQAAFKNCTGLKKIVFNKTDFNDLISLANGAFSGCTSLNEMYFYSQYPPKYSSISAAFPSIPSTGTLHHKPVVAGQTGQYTYQYWKQNIPQFSNWTFVDDL